MFYEKSDLMTQCHRLGCCSAGYDCLATIPLNDVEHLDYTMKRSYGCVSFGLITTGLVFTVFAIFQKDSQIGKVGKLRNNSHIFNSVIISLVF
uniref:G_PROTEIN_RECEP_F2_4 domain-containing protein n=1 Tax=Heterorhabditis bacteriophora TaxID=37862 RepID=A0A1I7WZX5_HETBA